MQLGFRPFYYRILQDECTYLTYPSDVFISVTLGEAEILIEAEADIVSVKTICRQPEMEEMLFECSGNCGLARGGKPGEPDGAATLLAVFIAFAAGETWMPGDVPV